MKVVILDDWEQFFYHHPEIERLRKHFDVQIFQDHPSHEELISRIEDADIILPIRDRTTFSKDVLRKLKNIKLIAQTGAGIEHIDMNEANRLQIPIATTPGGSAGVIELIFGFIIMYSRKLLSLDNDVKNGFWPQTVGLGLEGKTIGIIGLGKIGTGVAKIAKAFNMKVIAWGPRLTPERAEEQDVVYTPFEQLVAESQYIVTAVRLVPETRNLVNSRHFDLMRKDAFFINTSRGDVVDEDALLEALMEKRIGGAGLDVFSKEPLNEDHPFLSLENVILSPHIGWKTENMFNQFLTTSVDNIISFIVDKKPKRIKNPESLD
ncbi:D-2-hydroxyacid dehydrogenase family protein [Fredinandcohnia humi]